ncbi:MAG TPA: ABC transporter permease [Gemmatimonas sp.]|nr:ABC transporter permease [Gemmatimonas sp.]
MTALHRGAASRRTLRASMLLVALLAFVAIAAPVIAPYSPIKELGLTTMNSQPPSLAHPFGTDMSSRDVLSRVIYGAQISLAVAAASVALSLLLGTTYGALSAMAGGTIDRVMMRLLDVFLALPRLLVLLAITALWRDLPWPALALVIGGTGWYDVARLVRGEVQALLGRDFVLAAKAGGVGSARLLGRHLLPHLLPVLAVSATLGVAHTITLEASLGFLGLGVQPPTASWGNVLHSGIGVVDTMWWLTAFPVLAIVLTVISCNALGDALRDVFAPEQVPA